MPALWCRVLVLSLHVFNGKASLPSSLLVASHSQQQPQMLTYDTTKFLPNSDAADVLISGPCDTGIDPAVLVQSPDTDSVPLLSSQTIYESTTPVDYPYTIETQHYDTSEMDVMRPVIEYVTKENIEALESNRTTVQLDTVGEHVKQRQRSMRRSSRSRRWSVRA